MKKIIRILVFTLISVPISIKSIAQISVGFGVNITARIAPPAIPVYVQPECPYDGYIWTPGYWAYGPDGYYWVPGVWAAPPTPGLLWTPGYWGFAGGFYGWHRGYWGPHVGFYGGVNYGFGYGGVGFGGGVWVGNVFRYNTAVCNVNTRVVRNTYVNNTVIINNTTINRTSFNGPGGLQAQPSFQEQQAARENHFQPTTSQFSHEQMAGHDPGQFVRNNGGAPKTTAMNTVNGRRFNQQSRIAGGIANGSLNAGEARNLENRQANLNRTIHNDRIANGGALTPQERQNINARQNNLSNSIYQDKHNAAEQHLAGGEAGQRQWNQQQRIAQGIDNGSINARQAARNENGQQRINQNIRADQQANGGRMNRVERRQINRQQNGASRQIGGGGGHRRG